ncbi:cytochrome C [Campylobacter sp. 9BO]|uniref:cytochrome C n=1 Tax=Campylobacter sp. 9BO TaxID=3424759 RepID=UPI003D335D03
MKKIILSALLAGSLFANTEVYSDKVKQVYADASSKDVIGRLLPTNAVKILAKDNGRIKIEVQGYVNPEVPSVINFSDSQRVFTLAFAKTANFKTEVIKKGENGKWDLVKTVVYTDDADFVDDVKPMLSRAAEIYKNACGVCHGLHDTSHYKANQWPGLLKSMISRTAIDKKDEWLVIQYLQKHSSDVNLK